MASWAAPSQEIRLGRAAIIRDFPNGLFDLGDLEVRRAPLCHGDVAKPSRRVLLT
jgi:hypothetical protein